MSRIVKIRLTNNNSVHTLKNTLEKNDFFPPDVSGFELIFHPQYNHFHPFVISMLAAWADYWLDKDVVINCKNTSAKGVAYAVRMGLFDYLKHDAMRIEKHEPSGQFVPLRKLSSSLDIKNFIADVRPLLHSQEHAEAVSHCLSELTRNVIEHAGGASAYVCAQYYKNKNRVSIGVADCGIGIPAHLSNTHTYATDHEYLMAALRPGVTGSIPGIYGSPENAGAGLFFTKCIAHASGQWFSILSGKACFRLSRKKSEGRIFNRDPKDDTHHLFVEFPKWNGTVVAVDVGMDESESFNSLKNRIRIAFGQESVPMMKPKIRFV